MISDARTASNREHRVISDGPTPHWHHTFVVGDGSTVREHSEVQSERIERLLDAGSAMHRHGVTVTKSETSVIRDGRPVSKNEFDVLLDGLTV